MRPALWFLFAALGGASSCKPEPSTSDVPTATDATPAATSVAQNPHPGEAVAEDKRAASLPCRAIAVHGSVHPILGSLEAGDGGPDAGAGNLVLEDPIPQGWLSFDKGAHLVAKDPRTTRETTFGGPGKARVCVNHREEAWLAAGQFESTAGAGETPGADQWVLTPVGVVRYAAGTLRVQARSDRTTLTVAAGMAFVWIPANVQGSLRAAHDAGGRDADAGAGNDDSWIRVADGEVLEARTKDGPEDHAKAVVAECVAHARSSHDLTRDLLVRSHGGDTSADLPDLAARQVAARRIARASCSLAELAVQALDSAVGSSLAADLANANVAWHAYPAAGGL